MSISVEQSPFLIVFVHHIASLKFCVVAVLIGAFEGLTGHSIGVGSAIPCSGKLIGYQRPLLIVYSSCNCSALCGLLFALLVEQCGSY